MLRSCGFFSGRHIHRSRGTLSATSEPHSTPDPSQLEDWIGEVASVLTVASIMDLLRLLHSATDSPL